MLTFDGKRNPARRKQAEEGRISFVMPRGKESPKYGGVPKAYLKTSVTYAVRVNVPFKVETIEGTHDGKAGDYLAIGQAGEMYPIADDVFSSTYRSASADETISLIWSSEKKGG